MEPHERIERMLAEKRISADQARQLYAAMEQANPASTPPAPRQTWRSWLPAALIVLLLLIALSALLLGTDSVSQVQDIEQWMHTDNQTGEVQTMLPRTTSLALILLVPLAILSIAAGWAYNSIVSREEAAYTAWSQLESNYQRRHDLIPQLVDSVSRYLDHERATLESLTEQRSAPLAGAMDAVIRAHTEAAQAVGATNGTIPGDEQMLDRIAASQGKLAESARHLFAVVENYPDLRSADQFLGLQAQLEGTENRINVARMRFNEAVQSYNSRIRSVPANLIASAGGFQRKAYFRAGQEARDAQALPFQ
ncbi:LemA family protein [Microbulbifer sp.]|uniref:LemA family protein n=1 Tax=Microbulbifer sp. TaxID=1908541 RepID=UPI003F411066